MYDNQKIGIKALQFLVGAYIDRFKYIIHIV